MKITCPSCRIELDAPDESYGRRVECPECGGKFIAGQVLRSDSQTEVEKNDKHLTFLIIRCSWLFVKVIIAALIWSRWIDYMTKEIPVFNGVPLAIDFLMLRWLILFCALWFSKTCVMDDARKLWCKYFVHNQRS